MKLSTFPFEDQAWLVLRVGIAAVLGAVIGWERDRAGKSAGIRTHMLVAASAALAVGLGEMIRLRAGEGDPTRMMHAVFTGIGFIGAGLIWTQKRRGPLGITSAATVVMVAGIGAASGLGAPLVGAAVTVFTLLTLSGVYAMENRLRARNGSGDDGDSDAGVDAEGPAGDDGEE